MPTHPLSDILITGSTGQVGGELVRSLAPFGRIHAPIRSELDLQNENSIRSTIRSLRPRWIVNPAAFTAVDRAETESAEAFAINADAVRILGEEAQKIGAVVLHFSTDYIFSGAGTEPYTETDLTGPIGVYGASKLAGEQALEATGAAHLIFRTSWIYGATGKNFLLTVLRLARERDQLKLVADQHGTPTSSRSIAEMAAHVMARCEFLAAEASLADAVSQIQGTYHAAASGETTWFHFAEEALRMRRVKEPSARFAELLPIPSSEYPTPARRPLNSRLDCSKLDRVFNLRMPAWQESLAQVMSELP